MLYPLMRPLLFLLPPEVAHKVTLKAAKLLSSLSTHKSLENPVSVFGLNFKNPIGIAAGLDKNADYVDVLAQFGPGFIEVGTVTPKPQTGNAKPRLFRLIKQKALINCMGFNNRGVVHCCQQLLKRKYQGIVGINLGKNKETPLDCAVDDYLYGLHQAYATADYLVINISSPNTPNLRVLQRTCYLVALLSRLTDERNNLAQHYGKQVPLLVKVSPDEKDYVELAKVLLDSGVDGVIATNTSLTRQGLLKQDQKLLGGLSGAPITTSATRITAKLSELLQGRLPIIASGGVMSAADAVAKINAGASLVQVYTGLIYNGPQLIETCYKALSL